MNNASTQSEQLFLKYRERVFGFFVDFLSNKEIARDLTQDVFVKILQREKALDDIDDKDGYIYQMCRNRAFDYLKKAAYRKEYRAYILSYQKESEPAVDPAADLNMNREHYRQMLEGYLSKLPHQQRLIFHLSKREGLSHKKIAAQLNISPHTVRNHLAQAMKNIRSEISPSDLEMMSLLAALYWVV